jgi:hypothetical protein
MEQESFVANNDYEVQYSIRSDSDISHEEYESEFGERKQETEICELFEEYHNRSWQNPGAEKIICIEMSNNNKVYINYEENWTLKDVIYFN